MVRHGQGFGDCSAVHTLMSVFPGVFSCSLLGSLHAAFACTSMLLPCSALHLTCSLPQAILMHENVDTYVY